MKIDWIETEIADTFNSKKGGVMVRFAALRPEGGNWAAPQWLVKQGVGDQFAVGRSVSIRIEDGRVTMVRGSASSPRGGPSSGSRPDAGRSARPTTAGTPGRLRLPYGFMPIDLDRTLSDKPVFHDGSSGGDLLSGEILCELEALTPLLVANTRYPCKEADPTKLRDWGFGHVSEKKQIAEPLIIDGRVVIPGSSLKGMVRHALGALTSAPMERVAEHRFTYRPNLDFNAPEIPVRYEVRPARVLQHTPSGWEIEVFPDARSAIFVRQDAESAIRAAAKNGLIEGEVTGVQQERSHLRSGHGARRLSHRIVQYHGGIDGQGLLAAAFKKKKDDQLSGRHLVVRRNGRTKTLDPFTYDLALVPKTGACRLTIPDALYQRYLDDQASVLADDQTGHLTGHPLDFDVRAVARSIKDHRKFSADQLVYVEVRVDAKGRVSSASKVVSCGHHFRYRWAYSSSVRNQDSKPRACLSPIATEAEQVPVGESSDAYPRALSGARLMFGYVRDDKTNPIGKGVFERLGGRIAINHAVSREGVGFLGREESGFCVPLRILGQPKPSAWEFYLRQPKNGPLATYGDLPGEVGGEAGGELGGRKFYRHQVPTGEADIRPDGEDKQDIEKSDQATLARYICKAHEKFRFTVRFARLRTWELGALLAVLQPQRLADSQGDHTYAHKLGMGRPLGMGSVVIHQKGLRCRRERESDFLSGAQSEEVAEGAVSQFKEMCHPELVEQWLKLLTVEKGMRLGYPTASTKVDGEWKETIYAWHTNLRRKYSKLRRQSKPAWDELRRRVKDAGEM